MKNIFKNFVKRFFRGIINEIIDEKRIANYVKLGEMIYIEEPRRIDGIEYISVGKGSRFGKNIWLSAYDKYYGWRYTPRIMIGKDVYIGNFACITSTSSVIIEDGCVLSEFVYITDTFHDTNPNNGAILKQPLVSKGDVHIGTDTFIGYQACILPGVTLGKNCVVGSNSVVTRSFPDFSMVAGAPAYLIKCFSFETNSWESIN